VETLSGRLAFWLHKQEIANLPDWSNPLMFRHLMIVVTTLGLLSGCASREDQLPDEQLPGTSDPTELVETTPSPSPTPEDTLEFAVGWTEVSITNGYETPISLDVTGHFSGINACRMVDGGAVTADEWNHIAVGLNSMIVGDPVAEEVCVPSPETGRYVFDGKAEVKLSNGKKRTILTARGAQVCSNAKNTQAIPELVKSINSLLKQVARRGCDSSGV